MSKSKQEPKNKTLKFPKGFLWGTATAAHQIEGANINSDWWHWEETGAMKHKSGQACGSYQHYLDDHEIIEKINNNAYRFSIEWSRIEPDCGHFNHAAMQHYLAVMADLKKRGIKIILTLHHFTNPEWFANKGGWTNVKSAWYFKRYVSFVAENIGGLVDLWITINEPEVYVDMCYHKAIWPPQEKNTKKALWAYLNMALAHRMVYKFLHKKLKNPQVGFAMNVISFASYRKHRFLELLYVHLADRFVNHSFYDLTKNKHDFLGINYYFRVRLKQKDDGWLPETEGITEGERDKSDVGWVIYPHGIFDVLMDLSDFNLPIYITENGVAAQDDCKREKFIVDHLTEIYHALKAGVDVRGYFHWSLLDNFEWEKGFEPKFGLVDVDLKTFKRTIKPSGELYAKIAKNNAVLGEMRELFE